MNDHTIKLIPFSGDRLETLKQWLENEHVARWFPDPQENIAWARTPPTTKWPLYY